uniref:Uncharacterized protein n=1 Tax=Entomoneis paludosa TaxID=265537 RepID=A0A7S2YGZ4_9STRA
MLSIISCWIEQACWQQVRQLVIMATSQLTDQVENLKKSMESKISATLQQQSDDEDQIQKKADELEEMALVFKKKEKSSTQPTTSEMYIDDNDGKKEMRCCWCNK